MTDEAQPVATTATPVWYWLVAIACLLFEAAGAFLFANSLTLDPATLPLDQRAIFDATPQWMTIAWAVAIGAGLLGAIGLLLRRRFAEPLLLVSLLAVAVQFSGLFLVRQLRELTPEDHLVVPVAILFLAYGFWQAAKLARRKGWIRDSDGGLGLQDQAQQAPYYGKIAGGLLLALGAVGAISALAMTTSVTTPFGEVSNLDLMNRQQNYLLLSGFAAVVGAILLLMKRNAE